MHKESSGHRRAFLTLRSLLLKLLVLLLGLLLPCLLQLLPLKLLLLLRHSHGLGLGLCRHPLPTNGRSGDGLGGSHVLKRLCVKSIS